MNARVLVVDDEKLIRWSVGERLDRSGHEVWTAESGERALEMLAECRPDVMLLDVRLGQLDGLETLRRALVSRPDLVVVMMSAHGSIDVAVEAMKHGAVDFLVKPFTLETLDAAVDRAAAAAAVRRQMSSAVELSPGGADALIGDSAAMREIREVVTRLASSKTTTVLIEGESGSGKEVVARAIHFGSPRAGKPFLEVNCAALPESLLESELFGHERGAFTDARIQKRGLVELADGGSVMLDEIGDLPAGGQAKLLRLLEAKSFRRVGGVQELYSDTRVIAATNADLERRVADGTFRADLFFRLAVVRIIVPPLRDRRDDVPALAAFFVARYNQETNGSARGISPEAIERLVSYHWPGNVRELRNVIERAFALHPDLDEIRPEHLPPTLHARDPAASPGGHESPLTLEAAERRMIHDALGRAHGNRSQAARLLGVTRDTLRYRLKKFGMG